MKFTTIKSIVAAAMVTVGMTAVAKSTVTVGEVWTGEPWSKITVNYTLGGVDEAVWYKVAFDVTADGQTASVTNDAAKLTDGAATKAIDTVALFGKQVIDLKAKVKVTLIAVKPPLDGVQLWEDGPYFASCNVGAASPEEYGYYFWWGDTIGYKRNANDDGWVSVDGRATTIEFSSSDTIANQTYDKGADTLTSEGWIDSSGNLVVSDDMAKNRDAARAHLGAPWRMMTDAELQMLSNADYCEREFTYDWKGTGKAGWVVKGKGAYASNSVFFPAGGYGWASQLLSAGEVGYFWSSAPTLNSSYQSRCLDFFRDSGFGRSSSNRSDGCSVRPVR